MKLTEKITLLITELLRDLGYELVGAEYFPGKHQKLLRVYIDNATNSIGLNDCERVSKEISALLDVEDPINGSYVLEVSSPGTERPLFNQEHFQQYVTHLAKVQIHMPINNRRRFKGVIHSCKNNLLLLEQDGELVEIALSNINKAKLAPYG